MHNLEEKRMKLESTLRSIETLSNLLRKDYYCNTNSGTNQYGMTSSDEEIIRKKIIELVKLIEA
jgi:hypothetical protein